MKVTCAILLIFIGVTSSKAQNWTNVTLTNILCETKSHLHNISFTWKIDRSDLHRPMGEEKEAIILSPTFSSSFHDNVKWYLKIKNMNGTDNCSIFLIPQIHNTKATAIFSFSFFDSQGNLLEKYGPYWTTFLNGVGWGCTSIPIRDVVSPDNSLNLVCDIGICEHTNHIVHLNHTTTTIKPNHNHSQDFASSTKNIQLSDAILVLSSNRKEYPVERSVLAACSPVFANMIKRSMEKGENITRFNITDVNEEIFDELMKYIYTNKSENVEKFSTDLLIAANKYGLAGLETSCVEKISKNLTADNAVDTLLLADEFGFDDLKTEVIRFLAANHTGGLNNAEWKRIHRSNSKLIPEMWKRIVE